MYQLFDIDTVFAREEDTESESSRVTLIGEH